MSFMKVFGDKGIEIVSMSVLTNIENFLDVCIICKSIGGKIDPYGITGAQEFKHNFCSIQSDATCGKKLTKVGEEDVQDLSTGKYC